MGSRAPHTDKMAILKITRMGHPVLKTRAQEIPDPNTREIRNLIEDMHETLDDVQGAGLAAPQVHVSKRLVIFAAPREHDDDESIPETDFTTMTEIINPEWHPLSDDMALGWEGCLSVPGLTGAVPRHTHIRYSGYSPQGRLIERDATGFHARVFQHEFDHLDGILYPMRMNDLSLLVFTREAKRFGLPSLLIGKDSGDERGEA